jgi:hypothetical protein
MEEEYEAEALSNNQKPPIRSEVMRDIQRWMKHGAWEGAK